jgi:hypothetical protein
VARGSGNQPVPGDCLGFRGAGIGSCKRAPCEYAKAIWECLHSLIWGASLEIVPAQPIRVPSLFKRCRKPTRVPLHERHPGKFRSRTGNTEMEIQFTISLVWHLRAGVLRTIWGIQYADLSSLTLHVVHSEFRRSGKEVLYPMASNSDQIFFHRCWTRISAPLEPIIVWAWLLAFPELTIGSTRALRTGLAQGRRKNALAEETRSPTAKREKIVIEPDRNRPKKKVVRGMSLWMLASRALPECLYTTRRLCQGTFHIAGGRNSYQISDYQTRSKHTSLVHLATICKFLVGKGKNMKAH